MAKTLTLNTLSSAKDKRACGVGGAVLDFKGEEGNLHGDGKTNVW